MNTKTLAMAANPKPAALKRNIWQVLDRISIVLYLFALLAVFGIVDPNIFTGGSASTVIQLGVPLLVAAIGMTFCLVCGEVDLSVSGVAGLASTVAAVLMGHGVACPVAVGAALAIGIAIGMVNGALTAWLAPSFPSFPSFLITLAMLSVTAGVAQDMQPMQQAVAVNSPDFVGAFGYVSPIIFSLPIWYAAAVVGLGSLVLTRSRFGYAIRAVGISSRAARFVGFSAIRAKFWVLTVSGFLAAVVGVLMAGFVQAGFYSIAKGIEVDAIAAAVIGGTALFGGRGTVIGTVCGALVLAVLNTGLLILQVPVNWQFILKGSLIVFALATGEYIRRRASRA